MPSPHLLKLWVGPPITRVRRDRSATSQEECPAAESRQYEESGLIRGRCRDGWPAGRHIGDGTAALRQTPHSKPQTPKRTDPGRRFGSLRSAFGGLEFRVRLWDLGVGIWDLDS